MSRDYLEATTELPTIPAEDLHVRFFWYRYRRPEAVETRKDGTG
jgi:hypothetical protein